MDLPSQDSSPKATRLGACWTSAGVSGITRGMKPQDRATDVLAALHVRPLERREEGRDQQQMAAPHSLGALPKIGETIWYVAT